MRLRCAYLERGSSRASRKRDPPHDGHPLRHSALDAIIGQRRVEAACAAIHALEGHTQFLARSSAQGVTISQLGAQRIATQKGTSMHYGLFTEFEWMAGHSEQ